MIPGKPRNGSTAAVVGIFLFSRLACSLLVYWGHSLRPFLEPIPGGYVGVPNWWLNPWTTFDSEWYLQIAANGYDGRTTGFFPLYPWLLRMLADDQLTMALTGVIIANAALLIALLLVFRLTEIEWNRQAAFATVGLLAFSPAAPFWGAVYTESLFLALLAGTFLAVRTGRWWLAGTLGGLAALCRNPGFLIAGALFLETISDRQPSSSRGRRYAWLLPLGVFTTVQLGLWWYFKNPLAGVTAHFYRRLDWPWYPVFQDIYRLITDHCSPWYVMIAGTSLFFTAIGLLLPLCGWRKFRPGYLLIVGGITMMNLTYASMVTPHTLSATRYMAPLFPVAQALALMTTNAKSVVTKTLAACAILFLFMSFSFMFGKKYYLG